MKRFLLGLFLFSALLVSVIPAFGEDLVDVSLFNIESGVQISGYRQALRVRITNLSNEKVTGVVTLGSRMARILHPYQLDRRGKTEFVAFSPYYNKEEPNQPAPANPPMFVDVSTTATSAKRGLVETEETVPIGSYSPDIYLDISRNPNGLDFLRAKAVSAQIKVKNPDEQLASELKNTISLAGLAPKLAFANVEMYQRNKMIILGEGSIDLTDPQINTLIEYVVQGGQIVFIDAQDSAKGDPRWSSLLPTPGKPRYLAFGSLLDLGYNPERNPTKDLKARTKFITETLVRTDRSDLAMFTDLPSPNDLAQQQSTGTDPFQSTLPSFTKVAVALVGYFLLVVPLNILLLRKLQRPELMWITAPVLAIGFSAFIFRSASKLYEAPMSISATGRVISAPESQHEYVKGDVAMFSPQAKPFGWRLKNTQIVMPFLDFHSNQIPREFDLPVVTDIGTDAGTVDVPFYLPANLEFRELEVVQTPRTENRVKFSVGKRIRGFFPVTATNISNRTINDVSFVAGQFSTTGRTLEPGKSIVVVTDELKPIPRRVWTDFQKQQQNESLSSPQQIDSAIKKCALISQIRGQVALFGTVDGVPLGPDPALPHSYNSQVILAAFAPQTFKLP